MDISCMCMYMYICVQNEYISTQSHFIHPCHSWFVRVQNVSHFWRLKTTRRRRNKKSGMHILNKCKRSNSNPSSICNRKKWLRLHKTSRLKTLKCDSVDSTTAKKRTFSAHEVPKPVCHCICTLWEWFWGLGLSLATFIMIRYDSWMFVSLFLLFVLHFRLVYSLDMYYKRAKCFAGWWW